MGQSDCVSGLCAFDVGTDRDSVDPGGSGRRIFDSGDSQALFRLPKPDSSQDRHSLLSPDHRGDGRLVVSSDPGADLCGTGGDWLHGVLALAVGEQPAEEALNDFTNGPTAGEVC